MAYTLYRVDDPTGDPLTTTSGPSTSSSTTTGEDPTTGSASTGGGPVVPTVLLPRASIGPGDRRLTATIPQGPKLCASARWVKTAWWARWNAPSPMWTMPGRRAARS